MSRLKCRNPRITLGDNIGLIQKRKDINKRFIHANKHLNRFYILVLQHHILLYMLLRLRYLSLR